MIEVESMAAQGHISRPGTVCTGGNHAILDTDDTYFTDYIDHLSPATFTKIKGAWSFPDCLELGVAGQSTLSWYY